MHEVMGLWGAPVDTAHTLCSSHFFQGLTQSCIYIFQPELFVLREVDVTILQANVPSQQVLESTKNPARYK